MTPTALKEAAQVGVPRDKIVGESGAVLGTGHGPPGRRRSASSAPASGHGDPLPAHPGHAAIRLCPGQGAWAGRRCRHGVLEPGRAGRRAHHRGHPHGHAPLRQPAPDGGAGAWGREHLTLTAAALKGLGAEGLFPPITLSCRDHEGGGVCGSSSGTARSGPCSPTGWRRIRRWCGPWWRHRRRSMRRRRASRHGPAWKAPKEQA